MIPSPFSPLVSLPSFSAFAFEDTFRAEHATAIEAARAGTPEQRNTLQAAFKLAREAEEHRIEAERTRIAALNAAAFLAAPQVVLDLLDEERGRSLDLGEILMAYGIASVKVKRGKGKGRQVGAGTLGQGTISPFDVTVTIGDRVRVIEAGSRNDRHSKRDLESFAAAQAAFAIARGEPTASAVA